MQVAARIRLMRCPNFSQDCLSCWNCPILIFSSWPQQQKLVSKWSVAAWHEDLILQALYSQSVSQSRCCSISWYPLQSPTVWLRYHNLVGTRANYCSSVQMTCCMWCWRVAFYNRIVWNTLPPDSRADRKFRSDSWTLSRQFENASLLCQICKDSRSSCCSWCSIKIENENSERGIFVIPYIRRQLTPWKFQVKASGISWRTSVRLKQLISFSSR